MQGGISLTVSARHWRRLHLPVRFIMLIFIQRQQDGNCKLISDHSAVFLLLKPHNFSVNHAKKWREAFVENVWLLSPDSCCVFDSYHTDRLTDSSVFTTTAKARAAHLSLRNLAASAPPVSLLTFTSVFIFNSNTENVVYHRKNVEKKIIPSWHPRRTRCSTHRPFCLFVRNSQISQRLHNALRVALIAVWNTAVLMCVTSFLSAIWRAPSGGSTSSTADVLQSSADSLVRLHFTDLSLLRQFTKMFVKELFLENRQRRLSELIPI